MSWDTYRYEAKCHSCGHMGVLIRSSDDWGRSDEAWEGFKEASVNDYEFLRKRSAPTNPICKCGSTDIRRGALLND